MFLTEEEIRPLTGKRRHSAQVRALAAAGYKFTVNGLGQPVVAVAEVNRKLVGGPVSEQKPAPIVHPEAPSSVYPLDMLRGLGNVERGAGIYFLWRGPALMYVGRSRSVPTRIEAHKNAGTWRNRCGKVIPFTWTTSIRCARMDIDDVEKLYIRRYRPPFNSILYA